MREREREREREIFYPHIKSKLPPTPVTPNLLQKGSDSSASKSILLWQEILSLHQQSSVAPNFTKLSEHHFQKCCYTVSSRFTAYTALSAQTGNLIRYTRNTTLNKKQILELLTALGSLVPPSADSLPLEPCANL